MAINSHPPIAAKFTGVPDPNTGKYHVSLIPGDGIGPEIASACIAIFAAAKIPIEFEPISITPILDPNTGKIVIPAPAVESIRRNRVALKGPLATPVGKGHTSLNLTIRRTFGLFGNVRPCKTTMDGISPYEDVDILLVRENTEGEYAGIEDVISPPSSGNEIISTTKLITRPACERVLNFAFSYARQMGRPEVRVLHKSPIMRHTDGLFVSIASELAQNYPSVKFSSQLLESATLDLVKEPRDFSHILLVMPNLYGDILSDMCAGFIGGLGLAPSWNVGEEISIFEAVHGSAPDIAGKGIANPTAFVLAGVMMLRFMGLKGEADRVERAVVEVLREGTILTGDLGGKATTKDLTEAIIAHL